MIYREKKKWFDWLTFKRDIERGKQKQLFPINKINTEYNRREYTPVQCHLNVKWFRIVSSYSNYF